MRMENIKRHYALRLARPNRDEEGSAHLDLLSWGQNKGFFPPSPPFTDAAPPFHSGWLAVIRRRRWCWGGTLDHGEAMGGSTVEGGSPQCPSSGEGRRRWWTTMTSQTSGHHWWRCRRGWTTDSSGSYWSDGEVGGARMAAVHGELLMEVDGGAGTSVGDDLD
jgi:hypothetical protein